MSDVSETDGGVEVVEMPKIFVIRKNIEILSKDFEATVEHAMDYAMTHSWRDWEVHDRYFTADVQPELEGNCPFHECSHCPALSGVTHA